MLVRMRGKLKFFSALCYSIAPLRVLFKSTHFPPYKEEAVIFEENQIAQCRAVTIIAKYIIYAFRTKMVVNIQQELFYFLQNGHDFA